MRYVDPREAGWPDTPLIHDPVVVTALWNTVTRYEDGPGITISRAILNIKHPDHGWMSFQIPRDEMSRLAEVTQYFLDSDLDIPTEGLRG